MKPLYVTTVVFNRHDLLEKLFASIAASTRRPDGVYVVDHAFDEPKIRALEPSLGGVPLTVVTLENVGCAYASNWFLDHVPDDRVGCGDDVSFAPACLERMAVTEGDFVIPEQKSVIIDGIETGVLNPAACCLIRRSCVEKVGRFDEKLSPNFLYFDDSDFIRRMSLIGVPQTVATGAHALHHAGGSQTMQRYTPAQTDEHNRRFKIARANYVKKWGGEPFDEKFTTPVEL